MAEAYLQAKFHLDPSNRLTTVHERHRHTGQKQTERTDRQRTGSIGRTVLQTVAQKRRRRMAVTAAGLRLCYLCQQINESP